MPLTRRAADGSVPTIILELVGEFEGVDPIYLDPPLHDVVDPDALDELLRATGTTRVELTYRGLTVFVAPDRTVTVRDAPDA